MKLNNYWWFNKFPTFPYLPSTKIENRNSEAGFTISLIIANVAGIVTVSFLFKNYLGWTANDLRS